MTENPVVQIEQEILKTLSEDAPNETKAQAINRLYKKWLLLKNQKIEEDCNPFSTIERHDQKVKFALIAELLKELGYAQRRA